MAAAFAYSPYSQGVKPHSSVWWSNPENLPPRAESLYPDPQESTHRIDYSDTQPRSYYPKPVTDHQGPKQPQPPPLRFTTDRDMNDDLGYPYPTNGKASHAGLDASSIEPSIDEGPQEDSSGKKSCGGRCCSCFKNNIFLVVLLLGILTGVAMGIGIRATYPEFGKDARNVMYLEFPGQLFLRMLKMMIIPLIVSSLISGMAAIPGKAAGRLGGLAVLYYMATTFLAVLLGILLVSTIQPGNRAVDRSISEEKDKLVEPVDALLDLIRNAFPANIVAACFTQTRTIYDSIELTYETNNSWGNETVNMTMKEITGFTIASAEGTNVLGLVVFSIGLGIVVGGMGEGGTPVRSFVDCFQEAIIQLVRVIIWFSPIGIAFLLAGKIVGMADPEQAFLALAWYMMTVLLGLAIHGFILLPLLYLACARKNPFRHLYHMTQALLTALGTASSSATLPITMQCLEEKAGVDRRVSRFMLPVGATINMDGTALYEAVASIFIAQINNYDLDAGQIITVSITATAAAIGAAGVPEAGLVTMVIVLTAVGLPTDDIGLIFAIDWFLDRFRTMINVWGDAVGAGVVEALSEKQLRKMDEKERAEEEEKGHANPAYDNHSKL